MGTPRGMQFGLRGYIPGVSVPTRTSRKALGIARGLGGSLQALPSSDSPAAKKILTTHSDTYFLLSLVSPSSTFTSACCTAAISPNRGT